MYKYMYIYIYIFIYVHPEGTCVYSDLGFDIFAHLRVIVAG